MAPRPRRPAAPPRSLLLGALLAGCAGAPPLPPPPPPVAVPPGCQASLAGPWRLAADPSWRYLAVDDGGTVELLVTQAGAPADAGYRSRRFLERADAGVANSDAGAPPEPVRIVLQRTPRGLVGSAWTPAAEACQAAFRTEVLACDDGGLTLRSQASVRLGGGCVVTPGPDRVDLLLRP